LSNVPPERRLKSGLEAMHGLPHREWDCSDPLHPAIVPLLQIRHNPAESAPQPSVEESPL